MAMTTECSTNDITKPFHPKGKTRGAFLLPKGARNVYLNESEDSRNVIGELCHALQRNGHQ